MNAILNHAELAWASALASDEDALRIRPIDQPVGEPRDEHAAEPLTKRVSTRGKLGEPLVRTPAPRRGSRTPGSPRGPRSTWPQRRVPSRPRGGTRSVSPRFVRDCSITCLAGTAETTPDSISESRRSASRSQTSSARGSVSGSRLAMSRSASRARSSGASSSAWASRSRARFDMTGKLPQT